MIACVDSDAENIFIALTARELRADIFIVARASAEDSEKKMLRAGADRVISPYKTSGAAMARVALRPQVGGAFEVADYRMEEIEVSPVCEGVGKKIADVSGPALIVAVRHPDGELETSAATADRAQLRRPDRRDGRADRRRAARADVPATAGPLGDPADHSGAVTDGQANGPLSELAAAVRSAAAAVRGNAGAPQAAPTLDRPRHKGQGDYSTNAAMLLAPVLAAPPREIAERIGVELKATLGDQLERTEVAGPGFVNLWLSDAWHRRALRSVLAAGERFGAGAADPAERISIEFVSANPTGPLVAASGRHAAYGDALARILEHQGHSVTREYYFNDAGNQIRLLGASVRGPRPGRGRARRRLPGVVRGRPGGAHPGGRGRER